MSSPGPGSASAVASYRPGRPAFPSVWVSAFASPRVDPSWPELEHNKNTRVESHRAKKFGLWARQGCRNHGPPFVLNPAAVVFRSTAYMAPRANWKGFLRLSLVTCPVAPYPSTSESEKISFNQLNTQT